MNLPQQAKPVARGQRYERVIQGSVPALVRGRKRELLHASYGMGLGVYQPGYTYQYDQGYIQSFYIPNAYYTYSYTPSTYYTYGYTYHTLYGDMSSVWAYF